MVRKIIKIDKDLCNGCGLCASACHEAAIIIKDGKAELLHDHYCDGLGDCLPVCPTNAISFEMREAAPYDEKLVKERVEKLKNKTEKASCGCEIKTFANTQNDKPADGCACDSAKKGAVRGELKQWPVQMKLVPSGAQFFNGADILIAADCTAYAYGAFHEDFIKGKITLVGCPKLDDANYAEYLTDIFKNNDIKSVTVARMEVPCCGGIEHAAKTAVSECGKSIPLKVVVISASGQIVRESAAQC